MNKSRMSAERTPPRLAKRQPLLSPDAPVPHVFAECFGYA